MRPTGLIEAEVDTTVSTPTITGYLSQLAALCREVADNPELLPLFIAIIVLAPSTIIQLARGQAKRRIAA